jgi:hypothetical protein
MTKIRSGLVIVAALALLLGAACDQQPPTTAPSPSPSEGESSTTGQPSDNTSRGTAAHDRIAAVLVTSPTKRWPTTEPAAAKLLQRFPATVGSLSLRSRTRTEVEYGGEASASASFTLAPLTEAAGPGVSMTAFFETFANSGQIAATRRQPPDSAVLYLVGTSADPPPIHPAAAWATKDGQWLFGAEATDEASLEALVTTFDNLAKTG